VTNYLEKLWRTLAGGALTYVLALTQTGDPFTWKNFIAAAIGGLLAQWGAGTKKKNEGE